MNFNKLQVYRNPNIGVYVYANNKIAIIPPRLSKNAKKIIRETLEVDTIETTIAGAHIIGVFVAGNDNAILIPEIIKEEELEKIKENLGKTIKIEIIRTRNTALGNLIATNNKASLVSPVMEEEAVKQIEQALQVPVKKKSFLGIPTIGSMIVVNDATGLVHPILSDLDIEEINKDLGIEAGPATVNEGVSFVKTGILLNNKGVIVGQATTGPEIMNINAILG